MTRQLLRWTFIPLPYFYMKVSTDISLSGIILCMQLANERTRYIVMWSFIGWVHKQNDPCIIMCLLDVVCRILFIVNPLLFSACISWSYA